ncbi:MAG TPA: chorismate-binding protein [Jatrophihabitans sp.]|nr:chorismate-binding protein [Jatrophihabitans sp.]
MAELLARRLRLRAAPADLLRALAGAAELDTGVLVCLAGCWAGGSALIGWNPARQVDDVRLVGEPVAPLGEAFPEAAGRAVGGGWFGWWSYSGPSWFGYFSRLLRRDPDGHWWLEALAGNPADETDTAVLAGLIEQLGNAPSPAGEPPRISELADTGQQRHLAAVEQAITAIRGGQLYQVNVCARLAARLAGSPVELFAAGLHRWAPDYAAFLRTPDRTVVSFSPELFLHREGEQVRTAPIKGTRRRLGTEPATAATAEQAGRSADRLAAEDLANSAKERAENVMIVDLMRNDLSRVCRPGSVSTPSLLSVRPAPGVWHLVSEVIGRLARGATDADLLAACFPPGSVTGAPKLAALRLIEELEDARRGVFTGAIGYLGPDRAEFNVAIRTFEIRGDQLELGVGGGITAGSVPMQEWQECLVKAAPLLALGGAAVAGDVPLPPPPQVRAELGVIETMLALDGRIVALGDHLARLQASCLELYRLELPDELAGRLAKAVADTAGRHRVRLHWGPGLRRPEIEVAAAAETPGPVALHRQPGRTGSWRHKWADRDWLGAQERPGSRPLFTAPGPDGELALETSRGNLAIVCSDGVLRTPELAEDVLPGITRRRLLDAALDHGRPVLLGPVRLAELGTARLVLHLSSIAGVTAVGSLDGRPLAVDRPLLAEIAGWLG